MVDWLIQFVDCVADLLLHIKAEKGTQIEARNSINAINIINS